MGRDRNLTRQRILDAAFECFYRSGFSRVSVDEIAANAGITKRTLYSHFDSKDDLAAAVLTHHSALSIERIEGWSRNAGQSPARLIEAIFKGLQAWALSPGWRGSGFSRIAIELAELPGHPARRIAQQHKAELEKWIAKRCAEHGVAQPKPFARQLLMLLEGAMALMVIHQDTSYAIDALAAARSLMRSKMKVRRRRASKSLPADDALPVTISARRGLVAGRARPPAMPAAHRRRSGRGRRR